MFPSVVKSEEIYWMGASLNGLTIDRKALEVF